MKEALEYSMAFKIHLNRDFHEATYIAYLRLTHIKESPDQYKIETLFIFFDCEPHILLIRTIPFFIHIIKEKCIHAFNCSQGRWRECLDIIKIYTVLPFKKNREGDPNSEFSVSGFFVNIGY